MGKDAIQFIRQPYTVSGATVYTPAAGLTHSLSKDGSGNFQLKERNGRTFSFNASKRLIQIQDPHGKILTVTYDGSGRVATVRDCWAGTAQRILTFTYSNGRISKISDNVLSPARQVLFGYSASDQLTTVTDPEGKIWSYEYASATDHHLVRTKDAFVPARVIAENVYDSVGRVREQRNEGLASQAWKFHYGGYVTIEEKPPLSPATVGDLTYHYFDQKHRGIGTKDALGNRSRIAYDGQDHVVSRTSPKNETINYEFDGRHNLIEVTDPLQFTIGRTYDTLDRLETETDKNGKITSYTYEGALPLVKTITRPFGDGLTAVEPFSYNPDGTLSTHTDPEGKVTTYGYDTRGNVNQITLPPIAGQPAAVLQRSYTAAGDLLTSTDARGVVTQVE
jgi:YD repeat-containing protein